MAESSSQRIRRAFEQGGGILRLAPAWVPRQFCVPGRRMKLDPRDLYAYGAQRGGIDERWLSSTTKADNGPLTTATEGLSEVVIQDAESVAYVLLTEAIEELGSELLGTRLWQEHGGWPIYSKFFDNRDALPHHLHQNAEQAALVGQKPKPEAYYFPPQLNNHGGLFPHTYFGLEPGTTRSDVRQCLADWDKGDNGILNYAKAMKLVPGTGWYVPTGLLHAPGSLLTYEPQWASDVFAMFQSLVADIPTPWQNLVRNVPVEYQNDLDYLVELLDWDANLAPNMRQTYFRPKVDDAPIDVMTDAGVLVRWITYGNPYFSAREITVLPGRMATLTDDAPHGMICIQGHGTLNGQPIESPTLIRFGEPTFDEYFVSAPAARAGVTYANHSVAEPLVILQHFGPDAARP